MDETRFFAFPDGVERVLHDVRAASVLQGLLQRYGWQRAAIVCSRTLRQRTAAVQEVEAALGERAVLVFDEVGEHAPMGNVLRAAEALRAVRADAIVAIGGGSVLDFCKFVQIALSENARTRDELHRLEWRMAADGSEILPGSLAPPVIRQIAVPTTLATAEWTAGGTPVDETTRVKARIAGVRAAPVAIVYDPDLLALTPYSLLAATAVRGLDHAINTALAERPHPLAGLLAEKAVALYFDALPRLKRSTVDRAALSDCQLATWATGLGQTTMATLHGFSHWMTHIVAPLAGIAHSDAACVLMLAQARWFGPVARPRYEALLRAMGRASDVPFADLLHSLLLELELPTTLGAIGIDDALIERSIPLALQHPLVTRHNLRPIRTAQDIRDVLALAR
ncbi:MAG TPA: iron-containing alcohol dehydrogenase [Ramlibacter sp.]|nr:iron-containing alcohol dehydrogenase [Ramlibacter sp.]